MGVVPKKAAAKVNETDGVCVCRVNDDVAEREVGVNDVDLMHLIQGINKASDDACCAGWG